jgi:hypothetical protein
MKGRTLRRVLALYPQTRGFGFALFDSERRLVDWGLMGVRTGDKNAGTMKAMARLIVRVNPTLIVAEDTRPKGARRHDRIKRLHAMFLAHAHERRIPLRRFSRAQVFRYYNVRTKFELALTVAHALPQLAPRLPPKRKPWMSEDARQSLFDAAALGLMALTRRPRDKKPG